MVYLYYYSRKTLNTDTFVKKLKNVKLFNIKLNPKAEGKYILVFPTYSKSSKDIEIPFHVKEFLKNNSKLCIGIIGMGQRNFGKMFAKGANILSEQYSIPVLKKVELRGLPDEVYDVNLIINNLSKIKK